MRAIAVVGEAAGKLEPGLAAGDQVEHQRGDDRARQLGQDVGQQLSGRDAPAGEQADCNRRVEMPARDVADRISHRHNGQAKGQRNADQADPDLGEFRRQDGAAAAAQDKPEGADEFGSEFLR